MRILLLPLFALASAGCSSEPNPPLKARQVWLHEFKQRDFDTASALAHECRDEVGFGFSEAAVSKFVDCMQLKHEGTPRDWAAEGAAILAQSS